MADLKDRIKKSNNVTPTEVVVNQIIGKKNIKEKYPVNIVFDGDVEQAIRDRAKELGLGIAPYIKSCVMRDLNNKNL